MDRYETCLCATLREESGFKQTPGLSFARGKESFLDHPADSQGATMMGVTHGEYDAYRIARGLPAVPVTQVTDDEIRDIFRGGYWAVVRAGELPPGLDLAVFDTAVHSGPGIAIKKLQSVLGLKLDGHIGAVTLAACLTCDKTQTITRYMDARRAYCRSLTAYPPFRRGWEGRFDRIEAESLRMGADTIVVAVDPPREVAISPRAKVEPPPASMATSDTGNAAITGAAGGMATIGMGAVTSVKTIVASGRKPTLLDVILAVASEPLFWAGAVAVFSSALIWFERRAKLIRDNV